MPFLLKADIETIATGKVAQIWEESNGLSNNIVLQFTAGLTGRVDSLKDTGQEFKGSPETNLQSLLSKNDVVFGDSNCTESQIVCLEVINSFYDDIKARLKLLKVKTLQDINSKEAITEENEGAQQSGNSSPQEQDQPAGFELELLSLINSARANSGLGPLALNQALNNIARSRCDDMLARNYFSHLTPEGKDIKMFLSENGIMYKTTGENLQYCFPPSRAGSGLFFNSWMDSDMHRANILGPGYSQIGIALSSNSEKAIAALVFLG